MGNKHRFEDFSWIEPKLASKPEKMEPPKPENQSSDAEGDTLLAVLGFMISFHGNEISLSMPDFVRWLQAEGQRSVIMVRDKGSDRFTLKVQ